MQAIYLDVCTLCRPFDDQSFLRIRMETEAFNLILAKVHASVVKLMVSPVHFYELNSIKDKVEKIEILTLLNKMGILITSDLATTRKRTEELEKLGFGIADAAHLSFAEMGRASFITCDDKLLKICQKNQINVWVGNPVLFCEKEKLV